MRTPALLLATALCAGCVCLRHAVEKPERKAVDCGREASKPGDHLCKVRIGEDDRVFVLHVPKAPSRKPQAALVLAFHGVGSNAMQMAKISKFSELADRERFLVAYPQGLGVVPSWNTAVVGTAKRSTADEVAFVKAMLAEIGAIVPVDPARVYAVGFSNGGLLSHELACKMSETFAAIGVVAAVNAAETCEPVRAVPVIAFHGQRDPVVLFGGAEEIGFPSVRSSLGQWAARDGCAAEPVLLDEKGEVRCEEWPGCRSGAEVVLCVVKDGHHTWPGGRNPTYMGHTTTDVEATERMWAFFERHPMPAATPDEQPPEATPDASSR